MFDRRRQPEEPVRLVQSPGPKTLTPSDELPDYVMSSVMRFLEPFFRGDGPEVSGAYLAGGMNRIFAQEVERRFHVEGLNWSHGVQSGSNSLWVHVQNDRALLAKVIDYALSNIMLGYDAAYIDGAVGDLGRALREAGANYQVVQPNPERWEWRLQRRTTLATSAAVSVQTGIRGDAGTHLGKAWEAAYGQAPNPQQAYTEAILAVEAVAIPVVLPNDSGGTLGKVIGHLRANTDQFEVVMNRDAEAVRDETLSPIQVVIAMADLLWSNQTTRHAPIEPISSQQAEFAVHQALLLVQAFRASVRRKA